MPGTGLPRLLDVGCGDGTYAKSRRWDDEYDYTGIEIDPDRVAEAQARGLDARVGDATDIDEPDDSVDFCVAKAVLEHVPDHLAAVEECRRVLKPGGEFMVIVPSDRSFDRWGDYTHQRAYRRDALEELLVDGGFGQDAIEITPRMGWTSPGMAVKSIGRMLAPWLPYGYPRAWQAVARGDRR